MGGTATWDGKRARRGTLSCELFNIVRMWRAEEKAL